MHFGAHVLSVSLALAFAASQPPQAPDTSLADVRSLIVHQRPIFTFRAWLGAQSPAERAAAARARLDALTRLDSLAGVTASRIAEGMLVRVGERPIFIITQADADSLGEVSLEQASGRAVDELRRALALEHEERSLTQLVIALLSALAASIVFVVATRLLWRVRAAILVRIPRVASASVPALAVRGFTLLTSSQLKLALDRLVRLLVWGAALFLSYLWLTYVLTRFAMSRPWGQALGAFLTETLRTLLLGVLAAVPGLFTVVLILFFTRVATRVVSAFFKAVESGEVEIPWIHADTAQPTRRIVTALLWLFAIVVAYPYLPGSGTAAFKGVSVFAGVVISLGSTGIVNQAMSGLVLMYARAIRPGEYVRIDEHEGTVMELGMLATKLRTPKNEEITVPNAVVVSSAVKNYSRHGESGVMAYTALTIGYDAPWRQVEAMLLEAAARTSGLRQEPAPYVRQKALQDFYVEYQLNVALVTPADRQAVLSELHGHVQDVFNEHGVQIMSPHFESQPSQPVVIPRERWFAPPARRTP